MGEGTGGNGGVHHGNGGKGMGGHGKRDTWDEREREGKFNS